MPAFGVFPQIWCLGRSAGRAAGLARPAREGWGGRPAGRADITVRRAGLLAQGRPPNCAVCWLPRRASPLGSASSCLSPARRSHGQQGPSLRHEPGRAVQDREEVRRGAGGPPGGVDRGAVRGGGGPPRAGPPGLPGLAEERHRAEPAGEQPLPRRLQARQDPRLPPHHGLQADGADLPVPQGRRGLRRRQDRHVPDRRPLRSQGHGGRAEDTGGPGEPGGDQERRPLPRGPQLVHEESAGAQARVHREPAEGGQERHRLTDGQQQGGVTGGDELRPAPADHQLGSPSPAAPSPPAAGRAAPARTAAFAPSSPAGRSRWRAGGYTSPSPIGIYLKQKVSQPKRPGSAATGSTHRAAAHAATRAASGPLRRAQPRSLCVPGALSSPASHAPRFAPASPAASRSCSRCAAPRLRAPSGAPHPSLGRPVGRALAPQHPEPPRLPAAPHEPSATLAEILANGEKRKLASVLYFMSKLKGYYSSTAC